MQIKLLLMVAVLISTICLFTGGARCDNNSAIAELGSGPLPVYKIEYRTLGPMDIDDLIEQARHPSNEDLNGSLPEESISQTEPIEIEPEVIPIKEVAEAAEAKPEVMEPIFTWISIVSNPPGAEFYIDGIYAGLTPRTTIVEPGPHLVEMRLEGYQSWSQIIEVSGHTEAIFGSLTPLPETFQKINETKENASVPKSQPDDYFLGNNYRIVLLLVAFLSFILGSGKVSTWAISRYTTRVTINFPRDGEDSWAGLVEGGSNRVYGTNKNIFVLLRSNDLHLQVIKKVEPNQDGRWFTRYDPDRNTVYRIYAIVSNAAIPEGTYLEEVPDHQAIYEVGPVTIE